MSDDNGFKCHICRKTIMNQNGNLYRINDNKFCGNKCFGVQFNKNKNIQYANYTPPLPLSLPPPTPSPTPNHSPKSTPTIIFSPKSTTIFSSILPTLPSELIDDSPPPEVSSVCTLL